MHVAFENAGGRLDVRVSRSNELGTSSVAENGASSGFRVSRSVFRSKGAAVERTLEFAQAEDVGDPSETARVHGDAAHSSHRDRIELPTEKPELHVVAGGATTGRRDALERTVERSRD